MPRPRLTEALRARVEAEARKSGARPAVSLDRFIVRETPLPAGPPKEQEREGPFSITQGGYVLKKEGERFSTEVGLWRHIDIMEEPTDTLRQSMRIRMSILRFSW